MEDITDRNYTKKKSCIDFEKKKKNLDEFIDLNFESDTLLLADVVNIFGNICFNLYKLDPVHFHFGLGLAWQAP